MNQVEKAAPLLRPYITTKGLEAAVQASGLGKQVKIVKVGITATPGIASPDDTALPGAQMLDVADGRLVNSHQINISTLLPDTFPSIDIAGIAFYLEDGTMFAIYREEAAFLEHTGGTTLLVGMDLVMDNIPSESVIVESTGANLILGDWVPVERKVNGKALTNDISLTASDVKALSVETGGDVSGPISANSFRAKSASRAFESEPQADGSSVRVEAAFGQISLWRMNNSTTKGDEFIAIDHKSGLVFRRDDGTGNRNVTDHNVYHDGNLSIGTLGGVPITRKVNEKPLNADITLSAADVGAAAASHSHSNYVPTTRKVNEKPLNADITLSAADVGAAAAGHGHTDLVPNTRKVNSKSLATDITLTAADVGAVSTDRVSSSGQFGKIPQMTESGVLEVGPYIDFHAESGTGDYDARLYLEKGSTWSPYSVKYSVDLKTSGHLGGQAIDLTSAGNPMVQYHQPGHSAVITYKPQDAIAFRIAYGNGSFGETGLIASFDATEANIQGQVSSNYSRIRSWTDRGNAVFHSKQKNVVHGNLVGHVTGIGHVPGMHITEHGLGVLYNNSFNDTAHVLWGIDDKNWNSIWQFRNGGELHSPSGWVIPPTGDIIAPAFGGTISSWILSNFAQKNAAHGNADVVAGHINNVGAYVFAWNSGGIVGHGGAAAGSDLTPCSATGRMGESRGLPGTWRCMGHSHAGNHEERPTLWMRAA